MTLNINDNQRQTIAALKTKINSNPENSEIYWDLGNAYRAVNNNQGAVDCYHYAIKYLNNNLQNHPNASGLYNLKGLCFDNLFLHYRAIKCFQKAISLNKNDSVFYYNLSLSENSVKNYSASIKAMETAIQFDSDNDGYYNQLGLININAQKYSSAIHDERMAMTLERSSSNYVNPDYYYNLAYAEDKLGRYFDSYEDIKVAIREYPDQTAIPKYYQQALRNIKQDLTGDNSDGTVNDNGVEYGHQSKNTLPYDPKIDYTQKLDELIGLSPVKSMVKTIINRVRMNRIRTGVRSHQCLHLIFEGNPGTGKTTVAKLLCRILYQRHIISKQNFTCINATQMVFSHYGKSAKKVRELMNQSAGGVLFIDEAYYLAHRSDGNSACQDEAMDAFTSAIDNHDNDVIVIMAGYTHKMEHMLKTCNPGLQSRFPVQDRIHFPDYSGEECTQILRYFLRLRGFKLNSQAKRLLGQDMQKYISTALSDTRNTFANARTVENICGRLINNFSNRLLSRYSFDQLMKFKRTHSPVVNEITVKDVGKTFQGCAFSNGHDVIKELNDLIGLQNVKAMIHSYVNLVKITKLRHGNKTPGGMNMAFEGNPGTGKTTVAKLFCKLLYQEGLVKSNNYEFLSASMLESSVVGRSAENLRRAFYRAKGGVLFIDEAYALLDSKKKGSNLLPELVDDLTRYDHDEVVIIAGYPKAMENMLQNGNAGLSSRFPYRITFKDYTNHECWKILNYNLKKDGLHLANGKTKGLLKRGFINFIDQAKSNHQYQFANARTVEIFFKYLQQNFANRLCYKSSSTWLQALRILHDKRLDNITYQDVKKTLKRCKRLKIYQNNSKGEIGFR